MKLVVFNRWEILGIFLVAAMATSAAIRESVFSALLIAGGYATWIATRVEGRGLPGDERSKEPTDEDRSKGSR